MAYALQLENRQKKYAEAFQKRKYTDTKEVH